MINVTDIHMYNYPAVQLLYVLVSLLCICTKKSVVCTEQKHGIDNTIYIFGALGVVDSSIVYRDISSIGRDRVRMYVCSETRLPPDSTTSNSSLCGCYMYVYT